MSKKTAFWSVVLGIVIGQSLVMWLAPKYLVWYFTPPASLGFDCSPAVSWALARMQTALFVGISCGAIAGLVVGYLLRRKINGRTNFPQ